MKFLQNFEQFKINEEATANVGAQTTPSTIWGNSSMTMDSYDEATKTGKFTFKSGELVVPVDMKALDSEITGYKMFVGDVARFATVLKQNKKMILDILDANKKPVANYNNIRLVFAMKDGSKAPLTTTSRLGIFGKVGGQASSAYILANANGNVDKSNYDANAVAGYGFFVYESSATYVNQPTSSFGLVSLTPVSIVPPPVPFKEAFVIDKVELTDEAKKEIKIKTDAYKDKNIKLSINTGASKDNDNVQHDFDLIVGRYKTTVDYLNSLGFKNIEQIGVPQNVNDTKNIYGKFDSNLKSGENRNLVITPTK